MLEPPLFAMKELFQQTHRICTVILYLLAMQLISILPYRSVFLHYHFANPVGGEVKDQQDPYWSLAAVPACRHQHMHLAQLIQY